MSQNTNTYKSLFENRIVQVILSTTLILQIGIWVRNFAIQLFVMDKTHGDAVAFTMISVAENAPILFFSFIGGTFADRWGRPKRTMILCNLLSFLSLALVILTLNFATWKAIFFATLLSAIISQFSMPAAIKLFKNSFNDEQIKVWFPIYQTMMAIFWIFGPMLGTIVYQNFGINVAMGIAGVTFLISTVGLLFLPADNLMQMGVEEIATQSKLRQDMIDGVRFIFSKKILALLSTCMIVWGLASGLVNSLGIFIVTERLGLGKEFFQWFVIAYGAGMMLGGGLAMLFFNKLSPPKVFGACFLVSMVGVAILSWAPTLWVVLAVQFCLGIVAPLYPICLNTMVIENTPGEFIGRVSGFMTPMNLFTFVIALSVSGLLKQATSLSFVYLASALLQLIAFLIILPIYRLPKDSQGGSHVADELQEVSQ